MEKIKGFPLKVKSFRNIENYQKLKGGPSTPPPLKHGGGYDRVYVQGLNFSKEGQIFESPKN